MSKKQTSKVVYVSDDEEPLDDDEEIVERILNSRTNRDTTETEYLVKWLYWHENFNLWVPESNLNCADVIDEYLQSRQTTTTPSQEVPTTPKKNNRTSTKNSTRKSARLSLKARTEDSDESVEEPTTKTPPKVSTEQLMRDALDAQGLVGKDVGGQGDCLYRCISDQLFGVPDHHLMLRSQVQCELLQFPYKYWEAVLSETETIGSDFRKQVENYYKYVQDMSQVGAAAGSVCISAIIEIYQVNIVSYIYNRDQNHLIPYSYSSDKKDTLSIAWINAKSGVDAEHHYWSVRPKDAPETGLHDKIVLPQFKSTQQFLPSDAMLFTLLTFYPNYIKKYATSNDDSNWQQFYLNLFKTVHESETIVALEENEDISKLPEELRKEVQTQIFPLIKTLKIGHPSKYGDLRPGTVNVVCPAIVICYLPNGKLQQAVINARMSAIIQISEIFQTLKGYFLQFSEIHAAKAIGGFPYMGISGCLAQLWSLNYNGESFIYETYKIRDFDLQNREDFLSFLWLSSHINELLAYNTRKFPYFEQLCVDMEYQGESVHNMNKELLVSHINLREQDVNKHDARNKLVLELKRLLLKEFFCIGFTVDIFAEKKGISFEDALTEYRGKVRTAANETNGGSFAPALPLINMDENFMSLEARSYIQILSNMLLKKSFHHKHIQSLTPGVLQYMQSALSSGDLLKSPKKSAKLAASDDEFVETEFVELAKKPNRKNKRKTPTKASPKKPPPHSPNLNDSFDLNEVANTSSSPSKKVSKTAEVTPASSPKSEETFIPLTSIKDDIVPFEAPIVTQTPSPQKEGSLLIAFTEATIEGAPEERKQRGVNKLQKQLMKGFTTHNESSKYNDVVNLVQE